MIRPTDIARAKMPETTNIDYNTGQAPFDPAMRVELAINDRAEAIVFHNKPFVQELSWLEFDLDSSKLTFVMESGDMRDFNIRVRPDLNRYMQNAFQVLMVLMDESTGEPLEGGYVPLILHRA